MNAFKTVQGRNKRKKIAYKMLVDLLLECLYLLLNFGALNANVFDTTNLFMLLFQT